MLRNVEAKVIASVIRDELLRPFTVHFLSTSD